MKIGITTFQWSDNYGAVLQAHALQFFLQQRGHAVQIVDYRPQKPSSMMRRWLSASPRGCVRKWEANWKTHLFERFRKTHLIRTTESFCSASELRKIADRFDLLITGSDQVWNPQWLEQVDGLCDLYFLSFAGPQTRRIAYAASFGHAETATMKKEWREIIGEKLKKMDAISVREPSGVSLVRDLCGRTDAVHVVDPTLLMPRSHYDKLAGRASSQEGYLFYYTLHGPKCDVKNMNRRVSDALNLRVIRCCNAHKTALHKGFILPSPVGWLRRIRDASFMVTDSFHGVVFCLIFHTPFVALLIDGHSGSMNARIIELLKAVGLTHRIVSPSEKLPDGACAETIDWAGVDQKIADMRAGSVEFLSSQRL